MNVWDLILLLLAVAVFQSTLMVATVVCMTALHRVFDWNPFTTRRTRAGNEGEKGRPRRENVGENPPNPLQHQENTKSERNTTI